MQNKIRSVDLEPMNKDFSYVVIDGVQAARLPHKKAEELRDSMIDELASALEVD